MPRFTQESSNNHAVSSDDTNKLYSNFHGSKMINFNTQFRETGMRYDGTYRDHGDVAEFRARSDDDSGGMSPPLWHATPPRSPTETTPLQSRIYNYNHHHFNPRSPTARSQAIAQGKDEMMELVNNMPESFYELSLKDLVDHSKINGIGQTTVPMFKEREPIKDHHTTKSEEQKKATLRKKKMPRSGSKNRPVLLKMFVPTMGLGNTKSPKMNPCAKVSPKPMEGDKFCDKDLRKKRLSDIGKTNGSYSSSAGSSRSSNRSRSKKGLVILKMSVPTLGLGNKKSSKTSTFPKVSTKQVDGDKFGDKEWGEKLLFDLGETNGPSNNAGSRNRTRRSLLPACLSFLNNKKSKTKKQKDKLF